MGATGEQGARPLQKPQRVLLVASQGRLEDIRGILMQTGSSWMAVDEAGALLRALGQAPPDLVILDQETLRAGGCGLLDALAQDCLAAPLLVRRDGLSCEDPPAPGLELAGILDERHAPALLRALLGRSEPLSAGRTRILSGFGAVAHPLETALDSRAVQERLLGTLHLELQLPCAFLGSEPDEGEIVVCCKRGVGAQASQLLRLRADDPQLSSRDLVLLEADAEGSRLEAWCARVGRPRLALAPIHGQGRFHGGLLVLAEGPEPFHPHDLALLAAVSGQAALLLDNLELQHVAWARQRLVEKLLERVINAQEEERKWMASEIHDTVAQSLVGMHTMVQTCRQLLKVDPDQAGSLLDGLRSLLSESLGEIRQILFNLRPASLDDLGLVPSLENCARRFLEGTGIQLILDLPGRNQARLSPLLETTVFRIAQEALSNIKKHSGACRARLSLDVGTADLRLTVADDGRGLVWSEVSRRFQSGESHGLHGMQERSRLLGGHFRISNDPQGGTILEVVIPLAGPGPSSREAGLDLLLRQVLGVDGNPGFLEGSERPSDTGMAAGGSLA